MKEGYWVTRLHGVGKRSEQEVTQGTEGKKLRSSSKAGSRRNAKQFADENGEAHRE